MNKTIPATPRPTSRRVLPFLYPMLLLTLPALCQLPPDWGALHQYVDVTA